jgi:hypothetical protein
MTLSAAIVSVWAVIQGQWLWLALMAVFAGAYGWVAAFKAEAEIRVEEIAKGSFALDWLKVAAEKTSEDNWFPDHPSVDSYLISFVVHNKGAPFELKATLVSRSVKGLDREFPQGDRALRWLNVSVPILMVETGGQPRVDVAVIAPTVGAVRFLGPTPLAWQPLTATDNHVTGRLRIDVTKHGFQRIYGFDLSVGTADPPGLDLYLIQ